MKKNSFYIIITISLCVMAYFSGVDHAETMENMKETVNAIETIPDKYIPLNEFYDRYIDMDTVTGYSGTDTGLMIYTDDGNGYYLEVGKMD